MVKLLLLCRDLISRPLAQVSAALRPGQDAARNRCRRAQLKRLCLLGGVLAAPTHSAGVPISRHAVSMRPIV